MFSRKTVRFARQEVPEELFEFLASLGSEVEGGAESSPFSPDERRDQELRIIHQKLDALADHLNLTFELEPAKQEKVVVKAKKK